MRNTPTLNANLVLTALVVAVASLGPSAAAQAKPLAHRVVRPADLDPSLVPKGIWLHGLVFTDSRGDNSVTFTAVNKTSKAKGSGEDPQNSRYLLVRHVRDGKVIREVNDKVERCQFDLSLELAQAALAVTDLDGDGQAEVTFAYKLACRSDVSPRDLKLLVLEDGAKFILRGSTVVNDGTGTAGGEFKAEPAKASWPVGFYQHAEKLWRLVVKD
jgi:hypothetical protein